MLKRSLALTAILCASVGLATAQKTKNGDTNVDPKEKARNVKNETKKVYKDWVNNDVAYIITPEEKKAFKQLQTDEERENFIAQFWTRRDPDPDTEVNEYREQYYERIAYANEHYASGIPGWKTDRGRIYITFGKPDGIESHPSGGQYDRPSYEGGGSTTTYPFETWFYRHLDNVGEGVEIEFVDPTGSGEYRIARSPNEKDALANIPGAGLTLSEQLGLSNKADRITGNGFQNTTGSFQREQDSPFRRLEQYAALQRPPVVKYADLQSTLTSTDSPLIASDPLNFDVRVDFFRQSDDKVVTAFTVQADNRDLSFNSVGPTPTATLNIFGRIQSVAGKRSGIFEDAVTTVATQEELSEARERKSAYQKSYPLAPGHYKVDVVVRDVTSGKKGVRSIGFEVPKYDSEKLSTSTLILANRLYALRDGEAPGQFTIGGVKVMPNVSGVFKKGQEVGIYLQVYNAGIDQTTLRPAVEVQYTLLKGGKEVATQNETWQGLSEAGQRLTLARLMPTQNLPTGDYEIRVNIKDRVSNQSLAPTEKFTVKN